MTKQVKDNALAIDQVERQASAKQQALDALESDGAWSMAQWRAGTSLYFTLLYLTIPNRLLFHINQSSRGCWIWLLDRLV